MARHPLDHGKTPTKSTRLDRYLSFDRAQHPDRATLMMQRRIRADKASPRLRAFLEIARREA